MLQDYLRQPDRILTNIHFNYQGGRYSGRGVMTWHPDDGFHIEAPLERTGLLPRSIGFGRIGILREEDFISIRMRERNVSGWILAPKAIMRDRLDIILQDRLSIPINRIIVSNPQEIPSRNRNLWQGSVLLRLVSNPIFPDRICQEERIQDQSLMTSWTSSGILYESPDGQRGIGRLIEQQYLELSYALPRVTWSKTEAWRWGEAASYSLSISLGQTVAVLQREMNRNGRLYKEVHRQIPIRDVRPFAPFGNDPILDRDRFIRLTNYLARNGRGAEVCRRIFLQIAEATRQRTWQGRALLLGTILEAALRTLEGHPFRPGDRSFSLRHALGRFRERYFSPLWVETFERVLQTFNRLRHRNAHPDWLFEETGGLSDDQLEEVFNDMVFLSRFYGCMILAMAGFTDIAQP